MRPDDRGYCAHPILTTAPLPEILGYHGRPGGPKPNFKERSQFGLKWFVCSKKKVEIEMALS